MAKYIDADKLRAEIERRKQVAKKTLKRDFGKLAVHPIAAFAVDEYINLLSFIDTLQESSLPEGVNLDEEVKKYFQGFWPGMETAEQCNTDMHFTPPAIMRLARHFYELGLNARKED